MIRMTRGLGVLDCGLMYTKYRFIDVIKRQYFSCLLGFCETILDFIRGGGLVFIDHASR